MKYSAITLITLLVLAAPALAASDRCHALLAKAEPPAATLNVISYLTDLLKHRIIGDKELLRLSEGLERGELINPITPEDTLTNASLLVHRDGLEELFARGEIERARLLEWAKQRLRARRMVKVKRDEVRVETEDPARKIEFVPVKARGRFKMGAKQINVKLTHNVEWMSTPVTQAQWVDRMGANPSHFVNRQLIKERPDNPVENLTWWSAAFFANKLSIEQDLKPTYDFEDITDWVGKPEDGTLKPRHAQAARGQVKINAPDGDIYLAEGYRLPTEAEQEDLLQRVWKSIGNDKTRLTEIAWIEANSDGTTQPVGELRPLIINGKAIFDLLGNVWEWSHNSTTETLKDGQNIQVPATTPDSVFRGGSWHSSTEFLGPAYRHYAWSQDQGNIAGFRLVRTLNP